MALSIPIKIQNDDKLDSIPKSLEKSNFKTVKYYTYNFFDKIDDLLAEIFFAGKGFEIGLTKNKCSIQFFRSVEFGTIKQNEMLSEGNASSVLTTENLSDVSSDLNYILGILFGKFDSEKVDRKVDFKFHVAKEGRFVKQINDTFKLEPQTIFGNISNLHLRQCTVSMEEHLFDTSVETEYSITQDRKTDESSFMQMGLHCTFKQSGPIGVFKLLNESMNRLNNLAELVVGGIK